jgi:creatinine amidohydrolase
LLFDLEALSALALSQLIDGGMTTAVVPFGSVEHHGGHLPLGADAMLADAVGRDVAARLEAVLLPTVRFGDSAAHEELSGTITMSSETLTTIAVELSRSLARTGFAVIVLLSTHGGNRQGLDAAVQLLTGMSDAVVCAPPGDVGPAPGSYSGEWLTSVMLALRPELVDLANAAENLRDELRVANAERGRQHFERFVASSVQAVIDAIG